MRRRDPNEFDILEVEMGYVTPCHIPLTWRGVPYGLNSDGYSSVRRTRDGKAINVLAHRVRYEALHGPLEAGLVPDHLCKHRPCCNPAHMEAVTIAVNNRRGNSAKLDAAKVAEMRRLRREDLTSKKALARMFEVSDATVHRIITGQQWVDGPCPAWEKVKSRRASARVVR